MLWPSTVRSGDLAPLRAFAIHRPRIPDCDGQGGTSADAKFHVLLVKDARLPDFDFVWCEACFEDRIVGTAFETRFQTSPQAPPTGEIWACE